MHKHLKSSVTAAMVAGGLLGVGTQAAHADSLLFPYLNTNTGVFSFVTIANEGLGEFSTLTGYHLTYGSKPNPVVNRRGCNHFDFNVVSTPADMMTFEVAGKVTEPGGALFEGGSTAPVTSQVPFFLSSGQTAWLAVEPLGNNGAAENTSRAEVWGWAEVVDTAANLTLAYSTNNLSVNDSTNPNFATSGVGNTWHRWSWYPTTFVTTSWYVLPIGAVQTMSPVTGGGIRAVVQASNGISAGAYNRDETFISGDRIATVRCLGIVTRSDMLQPATVTATNDGGFLYAESFGSVTTAPTDPDDPSATYSSAEQLNYRIQSATAAAGVGTRTAVNREPDLDPGYAITLDAGP